MFNPQDAARVLPSPSVVTIGGNIKGAGFFTRALARLIDLVVHYAVILMTGLLFGVTLGIAAAIFPKIPITTIMEKIRVTSFLDTLLLLLGTILYEILCESIHGSTLGKLILGMTVVKEDGSRCGWKSAIIRSFAYIIDTLFLGAVGAISMSSSGLMKQRNGDKWAGTVVAKWKDLSHYNKPSGWWFFLAFLTGCIGDGLLYIILQLTKIL